MKKLLVIFTLFVLFSNSYAQNDSIRKPVECGTGRMMEELNQKIINDFITASEKDLLFGNGIWKNIGEKNTDEDILKEGLKDDIKNWDNARLQKSVDHGDYKYLLYSYQGDQRFFFERIALYNKTNFTFRTYDAFFYKNQYHREVIGTWKTDGTLDLKKIIKANLMPLSNDTENPENHFGQFLQINEDYTFRLYYQADCHMGCDEQIEGKYSFSSDNEINFYCNTFSYVGALCDKRKKHPKPFTVEHIKFETEGEMLILKK